MSAFLRVHHTFVVDGPDKFTTIRKLNYHVPVGKQTDPWRAALVGDRELDLDPSRRVFQQTEQRLLLLPGGDEKSKRLGLSVR